MCERQSPAPILTLPIIAELEILLLGAFQVRIAGQQLRANGSKRYALLAVLALRRGRVVGLDELIDAVWGENLPAAPRNAVQHHVARLRAVLGPDSIVASSDGYALGDVSVDARRFDELLEQARGALRAGDAGAVGESIEVALELWRGPPLQGLPETDWLRAEARRLEGLRVDALEERFEAALAVGEHRQIVSALQAAVDENPFRERLWTQLMLALYRCGRQAEALETFAQARRVLAKQLGLEPGPGLTDLQKAILEHDPAIAAVPVAVPRRGNVPSPTTSFVNRERELREVVALLHEHRLVTLRGPPGVGKSRLALEVVRLLESNLRDGAWLVELSRASGDVEVERVLARAVDARGPDPLARAVARLRDTEAILVLDACEHALAEVARVVSTVLPACPGVRVLATSREGLHLAEEVPVTVEPLEAPEAAEPDAADWPAVQLFAARARAARPGFELTAEALPLAAEITRRVDGLPLAIELAAARVNVLGLAELSSLVEQRLTLLRGRSPSDAMRTALQGLVEWSYELLPPDEKTLLHHLAVHRGGASLSSLFAGAEHYGLDQAKVNQLLAALVGRSIISVSFPGEEARYDTLDTVREYALERLTESGGLAAARKAHAQHFATLADAARLRLRGREWRSWVGRLERDHDNLWAALAYARDTPDPGVAIRLGADLGFYFTLAERVSEGRRFLEIALDAGTDDAPPNLRIEALAFVCYLATEELDLDAAVEAGERALALAATTSAPSESALLGIMRASALGHRGDFAEAAALLEEAHAAYREQRDDWGIAGSSLIAAGAAAHAGDVRTVAAMTAEVRRHAEAIGFDAFLPVALVCEAWVAQQRDDLDGEEDAYRSALDASRRAGLDNHASFALAGLGSVALARGDLRRAEDLERRAVAAAEAARAPWVVAHARVQLARTLVAAGDTDTAEKLYQNVVRWSETARPHGARETQFLTFGGNPATRAMLGLAELADLRGDTGAANDFRDRAGLATA